MTEDVTITLAVLDAGRDLPAGHWNSAQLALLGVTWPPPPTWRQRLIGTRVTQATYRRFLELKGKAGNLRKRRPKSADDTPSLFD